MKRAQARMSRRRMLTGGVAFATGMVIPFPRAVHAQSDFWASVQVGEPGFTQARSSVYIGFTINNPNQDTALADLELESLAYDGNNTVLRTSAEYIEWLAPGQSLVVADSIFLSEGQRAAYVTVRPKQQSFRPLQPLLVEDVRYVEERFSSSVTGTVRNPYPRPLSDVRVYAVFYDSGGGVTGGNSGLVSSLPAFGTASARVTVPEGIRPARVELSATLSILTKFGD